MHKNLPSYTAIHFDGCLAPDEPTGELFYSSPVELGSPLALNCAVASSGAHGTAPAEVERQLRTVAVYFTRGRNLYCYVATLFFYPEHASASRLAALNDLSGQLSASYVNKITNHIEVARKMLTQSVSEHLQVDAKAFRDQILLFARVVFALLGDGNHFFDMTGTKPFVETLDDRELSDTLMGMPLEATSYFGVLTPVMLGEISTHMVSKAAVLRMPHCDFGADDVVTEEELINAVQDVRLAFKRTLEGELRKLFRAKYGEVRFFFGQATFDAKDIITFLKRFELVLYPSWQQPFLQEHELTRDETGILILEGFGGKRSSCITAAVMDVDMQAVVTDATKFIEKAFAFLDDDYDRWSQKLDPTRAANAPLSAEELMSSIRFIHRRMGALAAFICRD